MLGLPTAPTNLDGSLAFQLDAACHRLIVQSGETDDLAALGLECADDAALDACLLRLKKAGIAASRASEAHRKSRRVARLYQVLDPAANVVELFTGLAPAHQPFASTVFPNGFRTGSLGMGHAVLVSHDLESMQAFYKDALGFGVTERLVTRVGPIGVRGIFLHCNTRHHSLALFDLPLRKRLHHFMLQAADMHDIGQACERAQRLKVPLSLTLGQHPDPDGTFSFYGSTPSGFDFELGYGSQEIDPRGWQEQATSITSAWGHKPQMRLQLKMAKELLMHKVMGESTRARELA
jgi:2,3-dihydroxybiphenyl 1,2-dioxygenase